MSGFKMDWEHWVYSLVAAFIGGGAGAVVTAGTAAILLPDKVNLGAGLHTFLAFVAVSFIAHGVITVMAYLQKSPLPTIEEKVMNVKQTTKEMGQPVKTTETVVETHIESK